MNRINFIQSTLFFLLIVLVTSYTTLGQTGIVQGKISDSFTQEELIGATVRIDGLSLGAVCDLEGNFVIKDVPVGEYTLTGSYYFYSPQSIHGVQVKAGEAVNIDFLLTPETTNLEEIVVTARVNEESEQTLLMDQKNAIVSTQSVGASEMGRKGLGDAESAVSSVSGVSKQEGVKNVFVRGLGDRYNKTLLNGLPIPSEDPEYKNIELAIFDSDIIKNIGVEKVFTTENTSDVGGASININSKELNSDKALSFSSSSGFNSQALGSEFARPDGVNYFGFTQNSRPTREHFDFKNSLDPKRGIIPINESYRVSGGKEFKIKSNPLTFYLVASHKSNFSYTEESVRNATTSGVIYQDQTGKKYSGSKNQLVLANVNYKINRVHAIAYNFLMLHSNQYYVGEYFGRHSEKFQDATNEYGFLRRQQINDNLLLTHQLTTQWKLAERWAIHADFSYNRVTGDEPDRRENYLSQRNDGDYNLTGSNRQKRFFSNLKENDFNTKFTLDYLLNRPFDKQNSKITLGYKSRFSNLDFEAEEYNFSAVQGIVNSEDLLLDEFYNNRRFDDNDFIMTQGYPSSYSVSKNNHSTFITGIYQFTESFSGIAGFQYDWVELNILYDVPGQTGRNQINSGFYLPNLHLRYALGDKHIVRLGASKTYTLPQAKEISPYQYVNIGYVSEGNVELQYSDNYNVDVKWDYHITPSELISVTVFYKRIMNPIGRVYKGNSAGLLTYDNIAPFADVAGVELELRKNILNLKSEKFNSENRLSFGFNFSYIYSAAKLNLINTPERITALEGASPFLLNSDLSYNFSKEKFDISATLVVNYFSDRIFTVGTMGYTDIVEESVPTLDFVLGGKWNKRIGWRVKAGNILNPSFKLTREIEPTGNVITLSEYKRGINISIGLSIDL